MVLICVLMRDYEIFNLTQGDSMNDSTFKGNILGLSITIFLIVFIQRSELNNKLDKIQQQIECKNDN